ncbi:MAG TPA: hypothetical protein VGO75_10155, partial [Gemmatimonadaceae bacterium]|nr:hypothetical protein [Gemmatimonadaceae bacterium]
MSLARFSVEKSTLLKIQQTVRFVKGEVFANLLLAGFPSFRGLMRAKMRSLVAVLLVACAPQTVVQT